MGGARCSHARATIAAGLPAVVRPLDCDQPDAAVRLERAGLALRLRRWSDLASTIRAALGSGESSQARARFARLVQEDDAGRRIVELVSARGTR